MGIQNWSENIILVNLAEEPHMSEELQTVIEVIEDRGNCDVVVDFSEVDIVTSSSIAKLLKIRELSGKFGHHLILCGVQPRTRSIFGVTGLDRVFEFAQDQFLALAGLQMVN